MPHFADWSEGLLNIQSTGPRKSCWHHCPEKKWDAAECPDCPESSNIQVHWNDLSSSISLHNPLNNFMNSGPSGTKCKWDMMEYYALLRQGNQNCTRYSKCGPNHKGVMLLAVLTSIPKMWFIFFTGVTGVTMALSGYQHWGKPQWFCTTTQRPMNQRFVHSGISASLEQ